MVTTTTTTVLRRPSIAATTTSDGREGPGVAEALAAARTSA